MCEERNPFFASEVLILGSLVKISNTNPVNVMYFRCKFRVWFLSWLRGLYVEFSRHMCRFEVCTPVLMDKFFARVGRLFFETEIINSIYSRTYLALLKIDVKSSFWVFQKSFCGGKQPGRYVDLDLLKCYFQVLKPVLMGKFFAKKEIHFLHRKSSFWDH